MRYNANKGEITLLKAKKRESQMRNNAFKGEITRKSNALKRQTQMRYNAFESFVSQFRVISLCLYVKACLAIVYYWQRPCFLSYATIFSPSTSIRLP